MHQHATTERTWIKIKRGLITDPQHRERMGSTIWLFQYMLDIADWTSGTITGWKDEIAAEEMGYSIHTIRKHRQHLDNEGYISSQQNQHSLTIIIHNYTNPREHATATLNPKDESAGDPPHMGGDEKSQGDTDIPPSTQGDIDMPPSTDQGDTDIPPSADQGETDMPPSVQGDTQGSTKRQPSTRAPLKESLTTTQKPRTTTTSSSSSSEVDSKEAELPDDAMARMFQEWERSGGPLTPAIAEDLSDLARECELHRSRLPKGAQGGRINGAEWVKKSIMVARQSTNSGFSVRYIQAILDRWRTEGMDRRQKKKDAVTSAKDHDEWMKERKEKAKEQIRRARQNN